MPLASNRSFALPLLAACLAATPLRAADLPSITAAQLRDQTAAMKQLVAACGADAKACEAAKVAADEQVGEPGKNGGYAQHWYWLRHAMDEAAKAKPEERTKLTSDAQARLDELAQQAGAPTAPPAALASARRHADTVLAGAEYRAVSSPSWLDRILSFAGRVIDRLLAGVGAFGAASPWLAPVLEWGFFLGAAAGLGFLLLRAFARQRLQVRLSEGAAAASVWDRESTDWARHAAERAAAEDWREALHGLYWAAILHLESKRAWRHDPSRTPREYVRLLQPGSQQREALAGLTRLFERVWYGIEASSRPEYETAHGLFEKIASASAHRPSQEAA